MLRPYSVVMSLHCSSALRRSRKVTWSFSYHALSACSLVRSGIPNSGSTELWDVETPDTSLVRRIQFVWWDRRRVSGGDVETPDTSLVRRNQEVRREAGRGKEEGGLETPDTSLVRRNQEETGRQEEGKGGVETSDTSLVRGNQNNKRRGREEGRKEQGLWKGGWDA